MRIEPVAEVLEAESLARPIIDALVPNENNYSALLMQPCGRIEVSAAGVRNRDQKLAVAQFGNFLEGACRVDPALAVTPEYAMPWCVLVDALKAGKRPGQGKLWVLGCESIKYGALQALKEELAEVATVLFEPLSADANRFVDPLAYVFRTSKGDNQVTVLLVQFKTHPSADDGHFEANGMQRGTRVYQFGGDGENLRLVSLICSDVFGFDDENARDVYDRALVIHIQLNPKPRQNPFRLYRERLLQFKGDMTEIICLNWASNVCEWDGITEKPWNNIAGSAWYLRPLEFDDRDSTLCTNHKHGLYYTWLEPNRTHALFFNYEPTVFHVVATKVAHIGVAAPVSKRVGPKLTKTCVWDEGNVAWTEHTSAEDGFADVVAEVGGAREKIEGIWACNPIYAERVFALCAGKIEHVDDWYNVRKVDSCRIDGSEVIRRMTFCQDTEATGRDFRLKRLRRCGRLWSILKTKDLLPPALKDFEGDFRLEWSADCPHQNAATDAGGRASVVYMGEESCQKEAEEVANRIAEFLRRRLPDFHQQRVAMQRVSVWFRDKEKIVQVAPSNCMSFDQAGGASMYDVGREK